MSTHTQSESTSHALDVIHKELSRYLERPSHIDWDKSRSIKSQAWLKSTLRHLGQWQWLLKQYSRTSPSVGEKACLFLSWQRIQDYPEHASAIINQISLWVKKRLAPKHGFIYALLRRYQRDMDKEAARFRGVASVSHLVPEDLLEILKGMYPEHWRDITAGWQSRWPLHLRLKKTVDISTYLQQLSEQGICAVSHQVLDHTVVLDKWPHVPDLPGYKQGEFWVQDPGAICLGELWPLNEGVLLDVGSAPGGKLMLACDQGFMASAVEKDGARITRLGSNLKRCGWDVQIHHTDACDLKVTQAPDIIVCDVPCSGSGVYAKHPEAVWMCDVSSLADHTAQQIALLRWALGTVKPGGYVIYSTCSIFVQENEDVVAASIGPHRHIPIHHPYLQSRSIGAGCLPSSAGGGFYYALIQREC